MNAETAVESITAPEPARWGNLMRWCDLNCPFASFPEKEHLDGACHTFIALYCAKYKRLVHKNGLCLDITEVKTDETDDGI